MGITSPHFPSSLGPATSAHQTSEDQAHLCPHPVSVTQRSPSSPVASLSEAPSAASQLNFNLEICPVAGQGQGPCGQERSGEGGVLSPALTSEAFPYKFSRKQGQSNFLHHLAFCSCPQSSFKNRLIHLPISLIYLGSCEAKATLQYTCCHNLPRRGGIAMLARSGNQPALGLTWTCTPPHRQLTPGKRCWAWSPEAAQCAWQGWRRGDLVQPLTWVEASSPCRSGPGQGSVLIRW